jgi:uncharacterized damage-inducible protein DinB
MISKPDSNEYAPFYSNYIALVDDDVLAALSRQAETSYTFLSNLDERIAEYAYAPGKWTIKEVLGHMIDVERIMAYRLLRFSRGDQQDLSGFEEDVYVTAAQFNLRSINNLAEEFRKLREANLYLYYGLNEESLLRWGRANGAKISVRALLFIIAGHEKHHLNIIRERYLI